MFKSNDNPNIQFTDGWQQESDNSKPAFDGSIFEAIALAKQTAQTRKDKQAIALLCTIEKKATTGKGDPRDRITATEQSTIVRWYLRSFEG